MMKYHLIPTLILSFSFTVFGQNDVVKTGERSGIKDFGSSLKTLKKDKSRAKKTAKNVGDADEETIKIKTELVTSDVLVVNQKGNAVLGLKQSDFVVMEDEQSQEIGLFSFGDAAGIPRSFVLILDTSTDLRPYLANSLAAAKNLVDRLGASDKMSIVSADIKIVTDFTNDKALLKKELDSLASKSLKLGDSGFQYSTLTAVLNEMLGDENVRPIVIFQTSGEEIPTLRADDNALPFTDAARRAHINAYGKRDFSFTDVKQIVEKSRATIYTIIPGMRFIGISKEEQLKRAQASLGWRRPENSGKLKKEIEEAIRKSTAAEVQTRSLEQLALYEVAKLSGGYTDYIEKPEDTETAYSSIFTAINNRYLIGYYPTNQERNGKRRIIKIEVRNHPEYIILSRKSYFVAEQ